VLVQGWVFCESVTDSLGKLLNKAKDVVSMSSLVRCIVVSGP